jgi:hypothetical protein
MSLVTNASVPTTNLTKNQIYAFAIALVKAGIVDKGGVEHNVDLIELSLKLSLSPEGLPMVLYTSTPVTNSELVITKPAVDGKTGQTITKPIRDPMEIFTALYKSKKNELENKRKAHDELVQPAELAWVRFDQNTPASERYDV